jgi:GT2 family glycosyltransferase
LTARRDVEVVVAVVSWNTKGLLDDCLASLHADVRDGFAEVWVIDNGSSDGSPEMVREKHPWARLVSSGGNIGYGPAANRIAAQTSSKWFAPANADTRVTPGALRALVAAGEQDARIGLVGPLLVLPDGSTQESVQRFPGYRDAVLSGLLSGRRGRAIGRRLGLRGYEDLARPADVDWIAGAFLLVRRVAWEEVGGFPEEQWMYAEDLDLSWQLSRHGWRVHHAPSARVHHEHSVAAAQAFGDEERRNERMMRATYDWLRRRRGEGAAIGVAATNVGLLAVRASLAARLGTRRGELEPEPAGGSAVALRRHRRAARILVEPPR